ncbi:hypothetical protein HPB48_011008 [Haemaphysalis longicornis]|uniref:Partial AB-hydrolase lipase domain-containing protein n=1 Tax=Haemaphysalis longicornis TaxID=44386 RepID=A0A9J6GFJ4_HAELO|nr:hypothetical protein HPB48_011008 [Haemaphysalis longicornis]
MFRPINLVRFVVSLATLQTEIIAAKGYPVQVHRVVTKDSYVLKVIRIPHGRTHHNTNPRPVVFLLHSLLASSTDYVINMPHQSLGASQLAI